jgi:hypothetical protein
MAALTDASLWLSADRKIASIERIKIMTKRDREIEETKVHKVMHEFSDGQLKSSSGDTVKNPKQAIAIGLSEARRAGAKIPKKKKS